MKFSCQKELILGAVQTTSKAAAGKSSIPALEGILLELEVNRLTVTGYNLDIGIKTDIEVNGIMKRIVQELNDSEEDEA